MAAERTEPLEETRSKGLLEKRPIENVAGEELAKKLKVEAASAASSGELKRVADIVLALLTMASTGAGWKPTNAEIELLKDARMKLEELWKGLAPKDIVARESRGPVIDDVVLKCKLKNQRPGTEPGDLSSMHQPLHSMNIVHLPSLPTNHHFEITKIVQKLLQPMLPEHPGGTLPSRDYMNKVFTCQMCRVAVNKVDTVLVCDACEKGFHLKCLQPSLFGKIPRGEWQCTRCLISSGGKALPPQHGRIMGSSNTEAKLPSSADKKTGDAVPIPAMPLARFPAHSTWTPPSRGYMNRAFTCQICDLTVDEVDTVILCDACEKGFHLKCLQPTSSLLREIPRGEWHCMTCLSGGKPLPPKYGRIGSCGSEQEYVL